MLSAMKPVESLHIVAAAIEIISQFNITWQTGSEAAKTGQNEHRTETAG